MIKNYIENANFEDTGFSYTLSLIVNGKPHTWTKKMPPLQAA